MDLCAIWVEKKMESFHLRNWIWMKICLSPFLTISLIPHITPTSQVWIYSSLTIIVASLTECHQPLLSVVQKYKWIYFHFLWKILWELGVPWLDILPKSNNIVYSHVLLAWRSPGTEEPGGPQSMRSRSYTRLSSEYCNTLPTFAAHLKLSMSDIFRPMEFLCNWIHSSMHFNPFIILSSSLDCFSSTEKFQNPK